MQSDQVAAAIDRSQAAMACSAALGVDHRAKALSRVFGSLRAHGVQPLSATRDDLDDFFASVEHLASGTRQNLLVRVRGFYEEALDAEEPLISRNPARRIKIRPIDRKKPPSYTDTECALILTSIRRDVEGELKRLAALRDYLIELIGMTLGHRLNELRLVAWSD